MGLEDKEVQSDFDYENKFKQEVYYCITYITHKCPLMQELFSKWALLTSGQQILLNYVSFYALDRSEMGIFAGIIKGIQFWDAIQDTEGACGYHQNPLDFSFDKQQEKQIFNVIMDIGKMMCTINAKAELCNQLRKLKACRENRKIVFEPIFQQSGDSL